MPIAIKATTIVLVGLLFLLTCFGLYRLYKKNEEGKIKRMSYWTLVLSGFAVIFASVFIYAFFW